jgi:hypothetical protein
MYPATDRVLLEHARLKLSHSHETERRAAEYTAQLERRVGELDIDLGRARDEASQLREELRRAKAAASEEVRCSAAATRSVKDLQAEVETLRRRCDQYQAKLVDVESDRDQAVATVQALRSAALWTPSGLQSGATVALLTGQLLSARQQQEEHKARALLRAAKSYQARKWHRMALPYLQLAASVSAAVAGKALELADAATTTTDAIRAWFGDGKTFAGGGVWKVTANSVESPKLTGGSVGFRSEKTTKGKTRIAIETRASDAPSKSSIVFGMKPDKNGDSYYVVELRHYRGGSQLRLLHNPQSGAIVEIANHPLTLSRAERADWVELWVELAGDRVRVGVGDWESLEANAVTADLDGCIGLFISGDSPFLAPIAFRNLRVEPL